MKTTTTKEFVGVRLRPNTIKKLEELSKEKEMNFSELIRNIVENYLNAR